MRAGLYELAIHEDQLIEAVVQSGIGPVGEVLLSGLDEFQLDVIRTDHGVVVATP